MSSHAQPVTHQFVQSAMHGICNVKIVEKKMEHALLQLESVDVCLLTLDVKLDAGGIKIKIMCISLEESLELEFYFGY